MTPAEELLQRWRRDGVQWEPVIREWEESFKTSHPSGVVPTPLRLHSAHGCTMMGT